MAQLQSDPQYPSRRAFVLKLRADASPEALAGRLENLVTGRQLPFASERELLAVLAGELQQIEAAAKEPRP